ncbi:MAG: SDR family NAD(P)-dependent oxidoreductase [Fimbriimonadaceae bacterium]
MAIDLAIVTGATSGIGRATAIALAKRGVQVALIGRRKDALAQVRELCPGSLAWEVDLTADDAVKTVVSNVSKWMPEAKIGLVNAAGIAQFGDFHNSEPRAQLEINLVAPLQLTACVIPCMLARQYGRVVSVSSIAAVHAFPGAATYSASKAGLLAATKSLNAEYRARGIYFTTVIVGATDTELWDSQSFVPDRSDMLRPEVVGDLIADILFAPGDRVLEEITIMPPKGIL